MKLLWRIILLFIVVLFVSISFGAKPIIDVSVEVLGDSAIRNIADSVFFSELLNTNKFTVALEDALKTLFSEMRLQDLFSTENVILSKAEQARGKLSVLFQINSMKIVKEAKEYIINNISGDYIYYAGEYIRVITGARFKYDGKNYLQDEDGIYVKGTNGKYYIASTFYSKIPHENSYYVMDYTISYELKYSDQAIKDTFKSATSVPLIMHYYDPYNKKLFKNQLPSLNIFNTIAQEISSEMGRRFMGLRKLYGSVENVKMPRVLITVGTNDGAKPGTIFGVYDKEQYIAELRVVRTGGDYSECEVTFVRKGTTISEGMKVSEKAPDFVIPFGIELSYSYSSDGISLINFNLLIKTLDIHREDIASFGFGFGYTLPDFESAQFELSYAHRIISGPLSIYGVASIQFTDSNDSYDIVAVPRAGLKLKMSFVSFHFLTTPDFSIFEIGGGLSW